jgi:hypothetical protein
MRAEGAEVECPFCLEPWAEHTDAELRSCEADLAEIERREEMEESRRRYG